MNTVQVFEHPELGKIRVVDNNNTPWFVGKDIAAALGYSDTFGALKKHVDDEDKLVFQIDSAGQKRDTTIINENGFYSLAFSSKLPNAKQVKNWIARDVLPILREHNSPAKNDDNISESSVNMPDTDKNHPYMPELVPIEREGMRVLLTQQLAEAYETTVKVISNNFNRNKGRYTEGKHYFALEGEAKREFLNRPQIEDGLKNATTLYLWTEKGALLHAKSLNTDKAWEVYEYLMDHYFRTRETSRFHANGFSTSQFDVSVFSPEVQLAKTLLESIMRTELEQKRQAEEQARQAAEQERIAQEQARQAEEQKRMAQEQTRQAQEQEQHTEALKTVDRKLEDIRDVVVTRPETWRKDCLHLVSAIAQKRGGDSKAYQDTNVEIFNLVDQRAHVSLQTRLTNRLNRMKAEGVGKSKRKKLNKIDIIAEDNKLIEIYIAIIKEMCVKYEVSPSVLEEAQSA